MNRAGILTALKSIIPPSLLYLARPWCHGALAWLSHWYYGRPSRRLVVIGVTGTNGKTTTVYLLARILEAAGFRVGFTSTVAVNYQGVEMLNTLKMTMPSGVVLQRWLRSMAARGLHYAVIEVSSEGLSQNRHLGIHFDAAVFTNLTPEHLEAHRGLANYRRAKGKLFAALSEYPLTPEKLAINPNLEKTIITNADDSNSAYYASFPAQRYLSYGTTVGADFRATDISYSPAGVGLTVQHTRFNLALKGQFDVYNALAALAAARAQGISLEVCQQALQAVPVVPGRVEVLQVKPFTVVVDYAYETEELRQLYATVERWPHQSIINVLGPTGGGRDRARIPVMGRLAGTQARLVFVTTDDPYDDDPGELAAVMADGALDFGKALNSDIFIELDRRTAIRRALQAAQAGDIVLVTGKGADQRQCLAGGAIPWDDRVVAREELERLGDKPAGSTPA